MRLLFVADPFDGLDPGHDSTVAMIEAAQSHRHEVWGCTAPDLSIGAEGAEASVRQLRVEPAKLDESGRWVVNDHWLDMDAPVLRPLSDFAVVNMRTDPPVDAAYLRATYLLDHVDPTRTVVVNRPSGLRNANEKLYAFHHQGLMPESLVSADRARITEFVNRIGVTVGKPTDGMAGRGILLLRPDDVNLASIIDLMTDLGRTQVVVQAFVPEVENGDRRVIVIDGDAVGSVARLATGTDFRCNMATGARTRADVIDDDVERIVESLEPTLLRDGLWFVGLDVIGRYLSEINVTSPTGIREIHALTGIDVADRYITFLEDLHPRETRVFDG